MACYKFYQDTKHTIWQRTHFTVEAPTEEEAIRKAAALIEDGMFDAEPENDRIRIGNPNYCSTPFRRFPPRKTTEKRLWRSIPEHPGEAG